MKTQYKLNTPMLNEIEKKVAKLMNEVGLESCNDVVLESIKYCHYADISLDPDSMSSFLFSKDKKEFYEERVAIISESGELDIKDTKLLAFCITAKN